EHGVLLPPHDAWIATGEMSAGEEARVEREREANVSAGVRGDSRLILDIVLELEVGRSGGDRGKSPHVGALAGIRSDCPDGPDRRDRSYLIACLEHLASVTTARRGRKALRRCGARPQENRAVWALCPRPGAANPSPGWCFPIKGRIEGPLRCWA